MTDMITAHYHGGPLDGQYRATDKTAVYRVPIPSTELSSSSSVREAMEPHLAEYLIAEYETPGVIGYDFAGIHCPHVKKGAP